MLLRNNKYFCAAQKSPLLFRAAHWNKQKYFDAFSLLWDDTKRSNCPGRVGFAKARYMKSFPKYKGIFVKFPVTKDTKTLKQHQQFFLECIDLISDDVNVKVISITCIGFIQ
jgi:hypothetical protein